MSARQAWLAARRGVDEAEGVGAAMPALQITGVENAKHMLVFSKP